MALAAYPREYLAKLDTGSYTETKQETATYSTDTQPTPAYIIVQNPDNSQFYMTIFFGFALLILLIYLLEKNKRRR